MPSILWWILKIKKSVLVLQLKQRNTFSWVEHSMLSLTASQITGSIIYSSIDPVTSVTNYHWFSMVITSAKPLNIFGFLMFGLTRIICNLVARFYTYGLYNMLPWKTDYVKLLEDKEQTISNLENNLLTIQDPLKGDKILQEIKEDKALTQMALENLQPLTKFYQ